MNYYLLYSAIDYQMILSKSTPKQCNETSIKFHKSSFEEFVIKTVP